MKRKKTSRIFSLIAALDHRGGAPPSPSLVVPLVPLLPTPSGISFSTGLSGLLLKPFPFGPGAGVTILGVAPPPGPPLRLLSKRNASKELGEAMRGGTATARCWLSTEG